jgi:hypothetical protein
VQVKKESFEVVDEQGELVRGSKKDQFFPNAYHIWQELGQTKPEPPQTKPDLDKSSPKYGGE